MTLLEFPSDRNASTSSPELQHPPVSEGVSLSGLQLPEQWQFDTTVKRIVSKEPAEDPDEWGNVLSRWRVVMTDGVKLGLNFLEPQERATDTAIVETPAWHVNLHGLSVHTQRALGALGIPSLLVGRVGQERDSVIQEVTRAVFRPREVVRELRQANLVRQAHNMFEILKYGSFDLDNTSAFLHGNSFGGMAQFPFIAMAQEQGIAVPFAMPIAPCFHDGFTLGRLLHHSKQLPNETVNAGRILFRNLFDLTGSGVNTVNPSPKAIVYEMAHGPSLASGDAGAFDDFIPRDQNMLILSYADDIAGQEDVWNTALADYPNIYVRGVPGAHGSIADKRTRAYVTFIFGAIAEQTREGVPLDQLDFTHVKRSLRLLPDEAN